MRSPSHGGTRPPWSGKSALPLRLVISESGSSRDHTSSAAGFASTGCGLARENTGGGLGDLIEASAAVLFRAAKARRDVADRTALLDGGKKINVVLRAPRARFWVRHRAFLRSTTQRAARRAGCAQTRKPGVGRALRLSDRHDRRSFGRVAMLLAHAPPSIHQGERQHGPE